MREASMRSAPPANAPLIGPRSNVYVVTRLSLQGETSGAAWPCSFNITVHGATICESQYGPIGLPHWLHHMRIAPAGPLQNPVSWLMNACAPGSTSLCVELTCE